MTQVEFQKISSGLPNLPGIYKYYDAGNYLLYVGKAKSIRKGLVLTLIKLLPVIKLMNW